MVSGYEVAAYRKQVLTKTEFLLGLFYVRMFTLNKYLLVRR